MQYVNHDLGLTRLRWQIANKEFVGITQLQLDSYKYVFRDEGLNQAEQELLIAFMGDSETLNSREPEEFCNLFLVNNIGFKLKFVYSTKRGLKHNYKSFLRIRAINKQIKKKRSLAV